MPSAKIVHVGAGSAVFSMEVVRDLCLNNGLSGCKLTLVDIDSNRLDAVYVLAKRFASELRAQVQIEKTPDLHTALQGADFVIDTALAGGHYQQEAVRAVGEKHGYYRGLEAVEFNMVADYSTTFQGYSQLKLFLDIAGAMEEICPDAWLIDVANPECEAGTLLTRKSKIKVVGYCHGYRHYRDIVQTLGLDLSSVNFQVAGFNHNIWLTRFECNSKNAYSLIDDWIENRSETYWEQSVPKDEFDVYMSRSAADMYRLYDLFPVGDTTRSGSWKYHYDIETKKYWYGLFGGPDSEIGYARYLNRLNTRTKKVLDLVNKPEAKLIDEFPPDGKNEDIIGFISSVVNDIPGRFVLDVRNRNIIAGLPEDVVVEVPVHVDSSGLHPEKIDPIPRKLLELALYPRLFRLNAAMEAFTTGNKCVLLELLYRDVRTRNDKQAEQVLEEVLNLPFNGDMRKHYS